MSSYYDISGGRGHVPGTNSPWITRDNLSVWGGKVTGRFSTAGRLGSDAPKPPSRPLLEGQLYVKDLTP